MTPTLSGTHTTLDGSAVKLLAGSRGPCITVQIPGHHPGASEGSRHALFHDFVRTAGQQAPASLVKPLEEIADGPEFLGGGPAEAIFSSPDFIARYYVAGPLDEKLVVASHFHLTPFLVSAFAPPEFFILALGRKHLRFLKHSGGDCKELELPPGVPANLEAAGAFDRPDHDLENRSAAGPSMGAMRGVHFGTMSDHEAAPEYLAHFFGLVDRGLKPVLAGKPLLLMGVHEQIAAYRRVAKYGAILIPEVDGNAEYLPLAEIGARAADAAVKHYYSLGEHVLAEWREMPDRHRTLGDLHEVLEAAAGGRVHRLCVRGGTEVIGPLVATEPAEREDLINAAVVETLRTGGEVFVLPQDKMPVTNPVAAILRY
jgi:hypothetical protein